MKSLIKRIVKKAIDFLKWVWKECKNWHTLVLLGVVCLVLSAPIWVCYALGFIFRWEWAFWVATGVWGFWMLPGAPFFALSISITLAIKKIFRKIRERKSSEGENQTLVSDNDCDENK